MAISPHMSGEHLSLIYPCFPVEHTRTSQNSLCYSYSLYFCGGVFLDQKIQISPPRSNSSQTRQPLHSIHASFPLLLIHFPTNAAHKERPYLQEDTARNVAGAKLDQKNRHLTDCIGRTSKTARTFGNMLLFRMSLDFHLFKEPFQWCAACL